MKVVVRGYEDGYNDIIKLRNVKIKSKINGDWYLGEYEESSDSNALVAVDLFGENKNEKL